MVELLLDCGAEVTPNALYLATSDSKTDVVTILADVMDDLDAAVGWSGNPPCAAACRTDGHNTVRVLLEKGANVNWQGGKYGCALQAATANYRLDIVKLLVQYGADVNAQCGHYGNVLTAAARHQNSFEELATLFLDHGADINAQGPGEYGNPLQTAVWKKHVDNVKFLLNHGASITVDGKFGSAEEIGFQDMPEYHGNKTECEEIQFLLNPEERSSLITED